MRKTLVLLSTLFIVVFGMATVSSAAAWWWGGNFDVVSIESADGVQRIQINNATLSNTWFTIDSSIDINRFLAIALTAQSGSYPVNISFTTIGGKWCVNGIRLVGS